VAIAFALPFITARVLSAYIEGPITAFPGKLTKRVNEQEIDEITKTFVEPFLRRNEVRSDATMIANSYSLKRFESFNKITHVRFTADELHMLEQILASYCVPLWTNPSDAQIVLSAIALRNDYVLFKQRAEQLELAGMSLLEAFATLVADERDESFLPFLQQLLAERQTTESATSLLRKLQSIRHDWKLRAFARDLEQRRSSSLPLTIQIVDRMDPYNFELLLGMMFASKGWHIIETPKTGDQGADVLLEKAGERTIVQAKLYADPVGNKAVQEAIAAKVYFNCHAATVVTNSYFTNSAQELAKRGDVRLICRDELSQMIAEFNRCPKDYARLTTLINVASARPVLDG
jgi:HJR/Mrr/RecB family endonuclease